MRKWMVVVAAALAGCVELGDETLYEPAFDEGAGGGGGTATFSDVQAVFDGSCAFAGCHGGAAPAGNLSLEEGQSLDELFAADGGTVPASHPDCRGLVLVEPGAPEESCLWTLVEEGVMPPGGGLPPGDRERIRSWIEAGATPDPE